MCFGVQSIYYFNIHYLILDKILVLHIFIHVTYQLSVVSFHVSTIIVPGFLREIHLKLIPNT